MQFAGTVAVLIILMGGFFTLGYWIKPGVDVSVLTTVNKTGQLPLAVKLQGAGTTYLTLLDQVDSIQVSDAGNDMLQNREVALNFLLAIAEKTTRVLQDNDISNRIIEAFEDKGSVYCQKAGDGKQDRIIWF
jgi:hypothetical protein